MKYVFEQTSAHHFCQCKLLQIARFDLFDYFDWIFLISSIQPSPPNILTSVPIPIRLSSTSVVLAALTMSASLAPTNQSFVPS
jgi:hypothetical protein